MITLIISLAVLILGYLFYGRFVERVFGPDDRVTPAIAKRDNVDFMVPAALLSTELRHQRQHTARPRADE